MKTPCNCRGWSDKYHCRDGISWLADGTEYQAHPPGEHCRCYDDECCADELCRCAVQVSPVGTYLVIDGEVRRAEEYERGLDVDGGCRRYEVWIKENVRTEGEFSP